MIILSRQVFITTFLKTLRHRTFLSVSRRGALSGDVCILFSTFSNKFLPWEMLLVPGSGNSCLYFVKSSNDLLTCYSLIFYELSYPLLRALAVNLSKTTIFILKHLMFKSYNH